MITFKAGTTILAEEVNSNFTEVSNSISEANTNLETTNTNLTNLQINITEKLYGKADTDLSNLSNAGKSRGGGASVPVK